MHKRHKLSLVFVGLGFVICSFWFFMHSNQPQSKRAIFSWSSEEVTNNKTQLLDDIIEHDFDRVFQSFSSSLTTEELTSFASTITEQDIDVYSLSGTPEWALDSTGEGMIEQLDQIVEANHELPEDQHIKGLVIDVEPYVLDDFEWDDSSVQQSYIQGMKHLYEAAKQEDLELIVVVPYFYDTKGYQEVVRTIIHEASSEVAVMNYYRDREIKHLTYEAQAARNANIPLTTIYEFKRPGEHGLTDKNTYFNEGRLAARKNANQLKKHYDNQTIHIAYHDYHAFKEVIENE